MSDPIAEPPRFEQALAELDKILRDLEDGTTSLEDALALVHTTDLPVTVLRRVVPGFCRSALEAAFITVLRRRRFAARCRT